MIRCERGRTLFETVLIIVFVCIVLSIAVNSFMKNSIAAKESLLQSELTNIRMSIQLFKAMNNKNPESLAELVEKEYMQPYSNDTMVKGKYLINQAVDDVGAPLDPFGNKYSYNKETGEVKSLTSGYDKW